MKLNEIKCPNCMGSDVEAAGEGLMKCRYCQTTFAIDYDEEDVAMDKSRIELQMQREKFEHQDKIQAHSLFYSSDRHLCYRCCLYYQFQRGAEKSGRFGFF